MLISHPEHLNELILHIERIAQNKDAGAEIPCGFTWLLWAGNVSIKMQSLR